MPQKKETAFRARIRPKLESIPNSFWESIQQKSIKGSPDIIGCVNGVFVALELKTDKGSVSALQEHKLCRIRKARGVGIVLTPSNFDDIYSGLLTLSKCEDSNG